MWFTEMQGRCYHFGERAARHLKNIHAHYTIEGKYKRKRSRTRVVEARSRVRSRMGARKAEEIR